MLVKLLFVLGTKGFQVISKVVILLDDSSVDFCIIIYCIYKAVVPEPLDCFV